MENSTRLEAELACIFTKCSGHSEWNIWKGVLCYGFLPSFLSELDLTGNSSSELNELVQLIIANTAVFKSHDIHNAI